MNRPHQNIRSTGESERKIRKALLEQMKETDFAHIRVTQVCQTAGVSRATFYLYYESLEGVLRQIEEEVIPFDDILQMPVRDDPLSDFDTNERAMEVIHLMLRNADTVRILIGPMETRS